MPRTTKTTTDIEPITPAADIDTLKSDMAALGADAKILKDDTVEYLKTKANDGRVTARVKGAEIRDNLNETRENISETTREKMVAIESKVRRKPLQSIATAFVTGAIVSYLMKRRNQR